MQPTDSEHDAIAPSQVQGEARPLPLCVSFVLCDRVIKDANDNTFSVIRIVDTITLNPNVISDDSEGIELSDVKVMAMLKGGSAASETEVQLHCEAPGDRSEPIGVAPSVKMTGGAESGSVIISPLRFPWAGAGLYWMKLMAGDVVLARTPFRINVEDAPADRSASAEANG